ncbi:MAG: hypothetical protein EBQ96_02625 [Proteobacteria bacterium]|nr:hypothetical protein [Pseudomonadota bacterium]
MTDYQVMLGSLSSAIAIGMMVPYIHSILKGFTRPHVFTWFLWGLANGIAGVAQFMEGGGPGAWTNLVGGVMCWLGAGLGYWKYGAKDIRRADWYAFIAALIGLASWALTKDPLLSVVMITVIDMLAFYPSFRKGWEKPHEDRVYLFLVSDVKHILGLAALTSFTVTTVMFPASLVLTNTLYILMLLYRRRVLAAQAAD